MRGYQSWLKTVHRATPWTINAQRTALAPLLRPSPRPRRPGRRARADPRHRTGSSGARRAAPVHHSRAGRPLRHRCIGPTPHTARPRRSAKEQATGPSTRSVASHHAVAWAIVIHFVIHDARGVPVVPPEAPSPSGLGAESLVWTIPSAFGSVGPDAPGRRRGRRAGEHRESTGFCRRTVTVPAVQSRNVVPGALAGRGAGRADADLLPAARWTSTWWTAPRSSGASRRSTGRSCSAPRCRGSVVVMAAQAAGAPPPHRGAWRHGARRAPGANLCTMIASPRG